VLVGRYKSGAVEVVKILGVEVFWRIGKQWKLRWIFESLENYVSSAHPDA
jgi:hypothetical protein